MGFSGQSHGYGCAGMSNVEYGPGLQELERGDSGLQLCLRAGALVCTDCTLMVPTNRNPVGFPCCNRAAPSGCLLTEPDFGSNRRACARGPSEVPTGCSTGKDLDHDGSVAEFAIVWARARGIPGFLRGRRYAGFTSSISTANGPCGLPSHRSPSVARMAARVGLGLVISVIMFRQLS